MDRKRRRIINFITSIVVIVLCAAVIIISFIIKAHVEREVTESGNLPDDPTTNIPIIKPSKPTTPDSNEITEAKFIDLQPTVDKWLQGISSSEKVGVMIYDLNNSRTAASYNADQKINVASIYKLLFAYDGYRQITLGLDQADKPFINTSEKGSLTLSQCLDLIIRESYNGCADVLAKDSRRVARVNNLIRELEMTNTGNIGLESTANDLTKLLRAYWRHTDITASLWEQLSDSMLNQPPSLGEGDKIYDWRQGLPAGFSNKVKVYNKVGWEWNGTRWNIYGDAAIIDFTEFKHYYTVVVLSSNLSDFHKITRLGQMIEDTVTMQSEGVVK